MHLFLYILPDSVTFALILLNLFPLCKLKFFSQPSSLLVFYACLLSHTSFTSSCLLFLFPPKLHGEEKTTKQDIVYNGREPGTECCWRRGRTEGEEKLFQKTLYGYFFMRSSLFSLESRLSAMISTTRLKSGESWAARVLTRVLKTNQICALIHPHFFILIFSFIFFFLQNTNAQFKLSSREVDQCIKRSCSWDVYNS